MDCQQMAGWVSLRGVQKTLAKINIVASLPSVWYYYFVYLLLSFFFYYGCLPCHHRMVCPRVADGGMASSYGGVAVNKLNKQPRTSNKGWSSSLGGWAWG
jgi:hypothetical protein